jgi:cell wall-associated NlpC family hydrolase
MKFYTYKGNRWGKRVVSALVVASFLVTLPIGVRTFDTYATTIDQAKDKKNEAENNLADVKNEISDIKDSQAGVTSDLATAEANLEKIMAEIEQTNADIADKQEEIEEGRQALLEAQDEADAQYESMKLRIQFMYENNTEDSFWTAILESDGLADMLTRMEYISDVYSTDRQLMEAYEQAVADVEAKNEQLANDMDELVALQDSLDAKKSSLQATIATLESQQTAYAEQLVAARELAGEYSAEVDKWDKVIQQLEAAAANVKDANNYSGGGTGSGGLSSSVAYLTDDSYNPDYATSVSPDDLVAYALQFVGNPYVWGGNSLTNGVDCSGFVHEVYAHFGISTPRYSQSFKTAGQPVSYNNMKAGDVVVYPGHVAIYIGNGLIVEAQSTKAGITSSRSVNCHTITAIRRLL